MSTSSVPAVLFALRDLLTTAAAADANLEVVFGAKPERSDISRRIYVGWSSDADPTMVRFVQGWAGLGARRKNEPFDVPCAVVVWSGDVDGVDLDAVFADMLTDLFVIFGVVENALRPDPGLGRPGPFVAGITQGSVVPELDQGRLRLPFTVSITQSRI